MAENVKRVNIHQKEAMVDFMSENEVYLFGKFSSSMGKGSKDAKWNELIANLNELGPPVKDFKSWKKVSCRRIKCFGVMRFSSFCFCFRHGST